MYYADKPIYSKGDDQLGRYSFSKMLAQSLLNLNNQDTFAIGLFGKWGSGKTSIVNMMLQEIEVQQENAQSENRLIVVHFEPWNFSNTDQLLTQFFIRLSNELQSTGDKHLQKVGTALEQYSDAFELLNVVPYVGSVLGFFGKKGVAAVGKKLKKDSDEKDVLKQKEHVTRLLKEQSNRMLVVIDDIDRLSNEQICQVFQLVTSVAKFPNTVYLLVFDRDIVVKALEKVQEGSGEDYLEKIIQMPIQIPEIKPAKLRQVLLEKLAVILSENEGTGFSEKHWQRLYQPCVAPFVDSLRIANRLCNTVQFKMASICTEIDFADIVSLTAIELQFPDVYEWIRANKTILTGEHDMSGVINRNRTQKDWYVIYSSQLRDLLQSKGTYVDDNQTEKVITAISYLFPHFAQKVGTMGEAYDSNTFRKENRVAHPEKFDRYFTFDLNEISIKKSELMKVAFELDCDELIEFMQKQENEGNSYELLEEIRAIISDLSPERAKIIITALFMVAYRLDTYAQKNFLSLRTSDLAEHMVIELLERVDSTERFQFICDVISCGDASVLQSVADVINMIELGYGRLAAKGEERGYKKVITLEELEQLEGVFTEKTKQVLSEYNLFDFHQWRMVYYLLEQFDADYAKSYLEVALEDDANIVRYASGSVCEWIGSGIEYEIMDSYKQYLTDERVLQAIEALKESGRFYLMPEETQNKSVAFYLNAKTEERNYDGKIAQDSVDKFLSAWKDDTK